jgi:hypothetical protein
MAIDLTLLLFGASTSQATTSPMAMYKRLQKVAEENASKAEPDAAQEALKTKLREMNNAAIRVRNAQYRDENARVVNDTVYYKNRAASATTSAELVNDDRFLKVLATANGYEEMYIEDRQKLRDILLSDLNDLGSQARNGSLKDLELAKKYNFGATGDQFDVDGNLVGFDADGKLTNDGAVTPLPASLGKIRSLALDINGKAIVTKDQEEPADDGKLIFTIGLPDRDISAYRVKADKTLLQEEQAPKPTKSINYYEFGGEDFDKFRNRSDVQREINYYKENIGEIESVDDFFKDGRLVKFVLSSFDLESEAQYPGKIRKILESDLSDVDSLANRFQDPRFKKMAEMLQIGFLKESKLKMESTTLDLVRQFERVKYEQHLDEQAPGVRAAIEFERRIKDVTQTVQLLGDAVMRDVVLTGNQIPKEIAYQEVDAQVTALEKRLDVKALVADETAIEKLITRYLVFKSSETGTGGSDRSYLLNLFG